MNGTFSGEPYSSIVCKYPMVLVGGELTKSDQTDIHVEPDGDGGWFHDVPFLAQFVMMNFK